jgi:hypothetical protein
MSPMYIIAGKNACGIISLRRDTAIGAVKKAEELMVDGHTEVQITAPDGGVYRDAEFHHLNTVTTT